ncbi:hypothetical protein [Corynebacterium sanguinis]|uniref:hypothetical protein n=1 Tax=Corynebacterium sanguinis TaxID=2594913 RepID=UPI0011862331|nr:hypothetical protein [Corynebacterium sanguinis]MCT1598374.1 hypothetical protein [Corynebacterium sanguinis]MCT1629411.1 hypothetical protein [Corynebacterium sanguinis]QDR77785.1 hypothetical protein E3227_06780 [Corynebacterium sanguinis]
MSNTSPHTDADDRQVLGSGSAMIVSRIVSAALGWLGSVSIARTLSPIELLPISWTEKSVTD